MSWTFGDLRTFFHETKTPSAERFAQLFEAMMRAHALAPGEVEDAWLPYALEHLDAWPDKLRSWNGVRRSATFTHNLHPLHELGRHLHLEGGQAEELIAYCHAPDAASLTYLSVLDLSGVTAPKLEQALRGLQGTSLQHLRLAYMDLDDDCAQVLQRATHLQGLRSLDLAGNSVSPKALLELAQTPHFSQLLNMSFGDNAYANEAPDAATQVALMRHLPALRTTLQPHSEIPWEEVSSSWRGEVIWAQQSVRERVETAISAYREANEGDCSTYPFLGEHNLCFGGYVEVDAQTFEQGPSLDQAYPRAQDLAAEPDYEYSTLYVLVGKEGGMEDAFDAQGALRSPLEFRTLGKTWLAAPPGRDLQSYSGACHLQHTFAAQGLCLDEEETGVLRLTPAGHERDSALVRYWRAFHATSTWVGGWLFDYGCSPWHEPASSFVEDVQIRATMIWEEHNHRFDARGALPQEQEFVLLGDGVAFFRALEGEGFEVHPGRQPHVVRLTERETPTS